MDSTQLLSQFRLDMDDLEDPALWSDDEVFEYLTDAQRMFCRLTEGIADAQTPSVCQLNIVPGTEWYPVSKLITKLRSVHRSDTGREVPVVNMEKSDLYGLRYTNHQSVLQALVTGFSQSTLRAYPVPSETITLNLAVFRLPLVPVTDYDQQLEIDEQHHVHLVPWMRHRGYLKQDADTYDRTQAQLYEKMFRDYCFKALAEQERARRSVGVTRYGGI